MVQIDIALSATAGATLALAARERLRSEARLWTNPYLAGSVAFQAFFLVPALIYFLAGWPSWDTMYWFDRETLPALVPPLCAVTALVTGALGFAIVHALLRRGLERAAWTVPAILVAPALGVLVAFHDRVLHVGTRATFAGGAGANLFASDLIWALGVGIPVWVGVPLAVLALRWNRPRPRGA